MPKPDLIRATLEPAITPLIVLDDSADELVTVRVPEVANVMFAALKISAETDL